MIRIIEDNEDLSVNEIEDFMNRHDALGVFDTRRFWPDNFKIHFVKIIAANQIVTFRDENNLAGLCSWMFVDENNKHDINKIRWTLPENIENGDIAYIDVCLLRNDVNIYRLREFLNINVKPFVKEVYWYNSPGGRVARHKFKGDFSCRIAD